MAVATSTCADDGRCGCKGLWNDAGGATCVLPPEIGKRLPTHSPSPYMKAPFQVRPRAPCLPHHTMSWCKRFVLANLLIYSLISARAPLPLR